MHPCRGNDLNGDAWGEMMVRDVRTINYPQIGLAPQGSHDMNDFAQPSIAEG